MFCKELPSLAKRDRGDLALQKTKKLINKSPIPICNLVIAKIATLNSNNITLRNYKKLYNPTHNKKICKHNIIQLFTLHN